METTQIITNKSNHSYLIRGNFNCQSTNVIYVLNCLICGTQCVGESSNTMNTRCRGQISTIKTSKDHPVALHYRSYNHTTEDFTITITDREQDKNRRLRLEESWITLLDTLTPKGLKWQVVVYTTKENLNWNDTFLNANNCWCRVRQPKVNPITTQHVQI